MDVSYIMTRVSLTILLLAFITNVQGQLRRKIADRYFNELAYYKAVEIYQELSESRKVNAYTLGRTAACYRLMNDSKNAEIWYEKLVNGGEYAPDELYYYAQILKRNKKYQAANKWMVKLHELSPNHSIAKEHAINQTYFADLLKDSSDFLLTNKDKLNSSSDDFAPFLHDSTTLFFVSSRKNTFHKNKSDGSSFLDIYVASINSSKEITAIKGYRDGEVQSKYHEGPIAFSNNNQTMYITRSNYYKNKLGKSKRNINHLKLFISHKKEGKWQALQPFPHNNDEYSVGHASVSEDGKKLFFVSDRPGAVGETDIWLSHLNDTGWSVPKNLGNSINTEGKEMFPYYHSATGMLYFASEGHVGLGGLDLFVAHPNGKDGFSHITNVGYPINTNSDDFGLTLVNDQGNYGYFSSNREEGKGKDDIYAVEIKEPFQPKIMFDLALSGFSENGDLQEAIVSIYDKEKQGLLTQLQVDENGHVALQLARNNIYQIVVQHPDYLDGSLVYAPSSSSPSPEQLELSMQLKESDKPSVENSNKNTKENAIIPVINEKIIEELSDKIDKEVKNIYYDYDKWDLREDAQQQLDQLAKIMLNYPTIKIRIASHTDSRASSGYNMKLSEKRAKAVINYLVSKGVNRKRLSWKAYSEQRLLIKCPDGTDCSEEQHQLNRRTEFEIVE